jgi:hypothetical protein
MRKPDREGRCTNTGQTRPRPFRQFWLGQLLAQVGVAGHPCNDHDAHQQQSQPEGGVKQHAPSAASLTTHTSTVAPATGTPLDTNQFDTRRSPRT